MQLSFLETFMFIICLMITFRLLQQLLLYIWHKMKLKEPPGPYGLPFIGHLLFLDKKKPYLTLTEYSRKYGPIYKVNLGGVSTVVLTDVALIREIFRMPELEGRAPLYLTHGIMEGYGLICAEGERWKEQRRFVNQTLKNLGMVHLADYRRQNLEKRIHEVAITPLINLINEKMNSKDFDLINYLQHFMGSLINDIVFGVHWPKDSPKWLWLQELQDKGTELIGISGPLNFFPFLRFFPKFKKTIHFIKEGQRQSHDFYNSLAEEYEKSVGEDFSGDDHLLGAYLKEQRYRERNEVIGSFTAKQRNYLLADIFGAGFDTTFTTLQWFLILIAEYSQVQEKIQEEIDTVIPRVQMMPTLDDCNALHYLKAAVAETQRFRSVVPLGIPHGTLKDVTISGYHIAKGTMIVPLQWAVHMDPNKWIDPENFNPENFLNENGHFIKPNNFLPFQTGKRRCVGEEMAYQILFLFACSLLREYTIRLEHPAKLDGICGITLKPCEHRFRIEPRK